MDNLSPAEILDLIFVFALVMSWDNSASISWKFSLHNRKYHRKPVGSSFPSSWIKLLYTPCSLRLLIQLLTHVLLLPLLRRLFTHRKKSQCKFFSPSRRHLDLDDSVPSLNAVSHDKKSASVRQADVPTNLSPTKNLQLCDKKSASVRWP